MERRAVPQCTVFRLVGRWYDKITQKYAMVFTMYMYEYEYTLYISYV